MIQTMAVSRLHDLAVSDRSGNIVAVVNQMEIMKFLTQLAQHFAVSSTTLDDYRYAYKKIISIDNKSPAIDAFKRLDALVRLLFYFYHFLGPSSVRFFYSNPRILIILFSLNLFFSEDLSIQPRPSPSFILSFLSRSISF